MSPLIVTLLLSLLESASAATLAHPVHAAPPAHNSTKKVKKVKEISTVSHRIRICNAYPAAAGLEVFKGREVMAHNIMRFRGQKKLTEMPLMYKMCGDFEVPLVAGDELKFMLSGAFAGTFEISDLPNNDALLLLVAHRHDTLTNAIAFSSHVFASLLNSQMVVIDTYKGTARSHMQIVDLGGAETLKYNKVVALPSGLYKINLVDLHKHVKKSDRLVALSRESYVVMRVGVAAQHGPKYPEEIVVYPDSDPWLLGNSPRCSMPAGMLMILWAAVALRH